MADQAVKKYISIGTTFDPCYLSLDSSFKAKDLPISFAIRTYAGKSCSWQQRGVDNQEVEKTTMNQNFHLLWPMCDTYM